MTSNHSALPTSSKLSRGIKGSIQRIFVGEKNNNQVIVYKYNIINEEWYKEYTISSPDPSILKFGFSLAGTDDASILAVGAPGITEGRVYIYTKRIVREVDGHKEVLPLYTQCLILVVLDLMGSGILLHYHNMMVIFSL